MKYLLLVPFIALLFACTGEKTSSASGSKFLTPKVVDKLMPECYMFRSDTIYKIMERASKDQVSRARQLFMQGLDLYINQKNSAASVNVFRESIMYCPDPKTYGYLANAYIDLADTARADSAMNIFFEPEAECFYTSARLAALRRDTLAAIENLAEAFAYGFSNKKKIENDKILDYLRDQRGFVALVVTYLKDETKLRAGLFKSFLAAAPDMQFPFIMGRDSVVETDIDYLYQKFPINYDFAPFIPGMEDSRFSRDVSNSYYMIAKFKTENNFYAVLYKSVMVIADTLPPVDVKMAVFDSTGALTDDKLFAQYQLPGTLITGAVDEERTITIGEYKMNWKTDPLENGYAGNEYMGEEKLSESKFFINDIGKLTAISEKPKNAVVKN